MVSFLLLIVCLSFTFDFHLSAVIYLYEMAPYTCNYVMFMLCDERDKFVVDFCFILPILKLFIKCVLFAFCFICLFVCLFKMSDLYICVVPGFIDSP